MGVRSRSQRSSTEGTASLSASTAAGRRPPGGCIAKERAMQESVGIRGSGPGVFFWIGFNAWFALTFAIPTALSVIASTTGQTGLNDVAKTMTDPFWVFILGTLINVAFGVLLIFGGQGYWRWQKLAFLFAGGSIL